MKSNHSSHCHRRHFFQNFNNRLGNNRYARLFFPLVGLASLIWLLIRIIPKPSRAEYPCMKVAAPIASSFIVYIIGLIATIFSFKKARLYFRNSKYIFASVLIIAGLATGIYTALNTNSESYANTATISKSPVFVPTDPANQPMGTAKGIFPGRVVWKWDPSATSWNGTTGNWWSDANTNQTAVDTMLSQSLHALTGKTSDAAAWDTLFKYFNAQHSKGSVGYQSGEKIAIKINIVQFSYSGTATNQSFTTPQLALALLKQLVTIAGVPDSLITFYDTQRYIPSALADKCKTDFPGVHFMGWAATSTQEKYVRDTTRVHWSENLTQEINGGNTAYLPTVITQASYLINLANFKGHRYMGVTFCSKNHFGSLSCDGTTGLPYQNAPHAAGVHFYAAVHDITTAGSPEWTFTGRPMSTYNPIVDLMGHKDLGAKTLLFMVDALYAVQDEGAFVSPNSKWLSAPFNNDWTSSLFLSQDNVAIESVCLDFFRTEAAVNPNDTTVYGTVDNYLHEAAQAHNPPSGTVYRPNGDGPQLQSLGVHEHWNNAIDKRYSRNLSTGNGIELFAPQFGGTSVDEVIMPVGYVLNQNYPNPFNPTTTISYALAIHSHVSIDIFDALGRNIALLVNEEKPAGKHQVQFNAMNLSSGIYFYRIQVRQLSRGLSAVSTETKKLVLLR